MGGASAGTLRYISVYAHRHTTVSRRDDIESLLYVLIYLYRGDVRWASRSGDKSEGKSERVLRLKLDTSFEVCVGRSVAAYEFIYFHSDILLLSLLHRNWLEKMLRMNYASLWITLDRSHSTRDRITIICDDCCVMRWPKFLQMKITYSTGQKHHASSKYLKKRTAIIFGIFLNQCLRCMSCIPNRNYNNSS